MDPLDEMQSDLDAAANECDYAGVATLWVALLKLANAEEGETELDRTTKLVSRIPEQTICAILSDQAVESLLNLDPPLDTVLSHPREKLETKKVTEALEKIRSLRSSSPREAIAGLSVVLKVIRNKREHGFKTRLGDRDAEILRSARQLLEQLCRAALQARAS